MKVIITLCLWLLLTVSTCFAAVPADLSNLLQQYKELNMLFDIGLSYQDFTPKYQQLYLNTRSLEDKSPEYKEDLDKLFSIYKDTDKYWNLYIYKDYTRIEDHMSYHKELSVKYPNLPNKLKEYVAFHDNYKYWLTTDIVLYLPTVEAKQQIQVIESKYNQ
jgi:hypothetical protein